LCWRAINKGTFIFLQSLGKAAASTLLSMAREIVFGVGLVLLLPPFFPAREDACKIEHDISEESFTAIRKLMQEREQHPENPQE